MEHLIKKHTSLGREVWYMYCWQRFVLRYFATWGVCVVIGCVALGFNLYRLGAPSIWFDEVLSIKRAQQSLPVLGQMVLTTQPNMALYYVILHFWLRLTGVFGLNPTEIIVRLPSVLFATLGSMAVYLLGKRFLGQRASLVAVGLYVINTLQLTYAQETRAYSLELLLLCISWYAFFSILAGSNRPGRWWLCYGLVSALVVYAHLFSLLVLFAQACTYGCLLILPNNWSRFARQQFKSYVVSNLGIVILIIPMLLAARHGGKTDWLATPGLHAIRDLFISIAGNNKIFLGLLALLCVTGLILGGHAFATGWKMHAHHTVAGSEQGLSVWSQKSGLVLQGENGRRAREIVPVMLSLLCWCIIPFVVSFLVSQGPTRLFSSRYLVVMVPPLLLLVSASIELLTWTRIRAAVIVLVLVCACFSVPYYYQSAQVENWNEVTPWLQQRYQPRDGMVCYDNGQGCQICIEYYLQAYPNGTTFPTDAPGAFSWVQYDLTNQQPGDASQAVNPDALAAYGAKHQHIFFIAGRVSDAEKKQRAEAWLDSHYQLTDQIVTATVTIRLYQTGAR